jgi:hypothetical protein
MPRRPALVAVLSVVLVAAQASGKTADSRLYSFLGLIGGAGDENVMGDACTYTHR